MKVGILALIPILLLAVIGCSKKDESSNQRETAPIAGHSTKKEAVVVVPEIVKGKWKAVKIAVADKETNREAVHTVAIGPEVPITDTGLSIQVENFLPHFMMEGTTLTSQTNDPKNPAAQVRIMDGDKEIFKGWLFSLYPTTHAFQHPKYAFTLVDFIPAK